MSEKRGTKAHPERVLQFRSPRDMALPHQEDFEYLDGLMETNHYKAFIVIHTTLMEQMRHALFFRFTKDEPDLRWSLILKHFQSFRLLTEICFIVGIIDRTLKEKLIKLNRDRNEIIGHLHPGLKADVPDQRVLEICRRGLDLMKELNEDITKILQKKE
jgi:hypothetical protein